MFQKLKTWYVTRFKNRSVFKTVEDLFHEQIGNMVCPSCMNKIPLYGTFPNEKTICMNPGHTEVEYDCPHCRVRLNETNLRLNRVAP